MSAGTLAVTNQSATVTGTGTTFTTELKTGDFIGVIVGGVPYTLVVLNIASDTSLTIGAAYTGPTSSDLAWYAVPATLQVAITQKVLNDVATMTRGMILDRTNWQQFYTGEGDITINLPDTSPVTGPSWPAMQQSIRDGIKGRAASGSNSDITELKGLTTPLSVGQGGTGATSATAALAALGGLAKTGGVLSGGLSYSAPALGRQSLLNMGVALNSSGIHIPISTTQAIRIHAAAVVVALDSNGSAIVTFPVSYSSVLSCTVTSGNYNAMTGSISLNSLGATGFAMVCRTASGGNPGAVNIQLNYIAMGVINL